MPTPSRRPRPWLLASLLTVAAASPAPAALAQPKNAGAGARAPSRQASATEAKLANGASKPARPAPLLSPAPETLLVTAPKELKLTEAQKATVKAALEALRAAPGAARQGGQEVFTMLASGVRSGQIDVAEIARRENDAELLRRSLIAGSVKTLHDMLTRAQRSELVTAILLRALAQADAAPSPPAPARPATPLESAPATTRRGRLGRLLDGLGLSAAQEASIDQALASRHLAPPDAVTVEARRSSLRSRFATFASDDLDAMAFVTPLTTGSTPEGRATRLARRLTLVLPLLTDAQREQLAARLEAEPQALEKRYGI